MHFRPGSYFFCSKKVNWHDEERRHEANEECRHLQEVDLLKSKVAEASIWAQQDTVVASTVCDTLGHYVIPGLHAGTYLVFAAKEGFDTVRVDDVIIREGNRTTLDVILPVK
jgi:Carboxypeptidase regulatory-like domain